MSHPDTLPSPDERAVWIKGGRFYVCHAIDGDDCVGPFDTEAEAKRALRRGMKKRPVSGAKSVARDTGTPYSQNSHFGPKKYGTVQDAGNRKRFRGLSNDHCTTPQTPAQGAESGHTSGEKSGEVAR